MTLQVLPTQGRSLAGDVAGAKLHRHTGRTSGAQKPFYRREKPHSACTQPVTVNSSLTISRRVDSKQHRQFLSSSA